MGRTLNLFGSLGLGSPSLISVLIIAHLSAFVKHFFIFLEDFIRPRPHRAENSNRRSGCNLGTAWGIRPSDQDRKDKLRKSYPFSFPLGDYSIAYSL